MVCEGTFEEYWTRLNARRREKTAEKKRASGVEGWKDYQRARNVEGVKSDQRRNWHQTHPLLSEWQGRLFHPPH